MVIAKDITEYSKLRIQNTVDKALPLMEWKEIFDSILDAKHIL